MTSRHTLFVNLGWKVVSVLLATLVWLLVHYNTSERFRPQRTRVFDAIPVAILSNPLNARVCRLSPPAARLVLRAPENVLKALRPDDLQLFVNLSTSDGLAGYATVEVRIPPGVTVVSLIPSQVRLDPLPDRSPPSTPVSPSPSPSLSDPPPASPPS